MEERRIRVKGIGNIELEPDYIIIYLTIESIQKKYEKAVEEVDKRVDLLKEALLAQGFEADELKCADYKVNANINYKRDHKGFVVNTINDGFCCTNRLKLEFDFDNERLSRALQTITNRVTEPKLNISFTVKDEEAAKDKLLKTAASNARRRALILCEAAGGKLGDLISVDYNWNSLDMHSSTRFSDTTLLPPLPFGNEATAPSAPSIAPAQFKPENISLSDSALFVWEIV